MKMIPDDQIAENFKDDNAYSRWQKFNIRYKLILFALHSNASQMPSSAS